MTDRQELNLNVGRLLVARIPGLTLDHRSKQALTEGTIGGAVLFRENAKDLKQLYDLTSSIIKHSLHVPVLTVDQEGGAVQRFDQVITALPSPMALSACADPDMVQRITKIGAAQLKSLGFNCLLAPVLDVLSNPLNPIIGTRAYSDNPHKVSELGALVAQAIEEAGLIPAGKHFPGHGSTVEDSHTDLAVNAAETRELWRVDLLPFRNILKYLPAILIGHIWLSAVDPDPLPATLSRRVSQGILRDYLNYDGLLVSDDMVMKAITNRWGLPEACVMALEAGIDLLLVCAEIEDTIAVHKHIVESVESGRLPESRIADAKARVDRLFSKRLKPMSKKALAQFESDLGLMHDHALAGSCSAVTILRGDVPAINSGSWLVVVPNHARYPLKLVEHLNEIARKRFTTLNFSEIRYSLDPSAEESSVVQVECSERNCIFLTYRALTNQGQLHLGSLISEEAREKVTVSVDVPFDILGLPAWDNCVATYDPSELAMEALRQSAFGRIHTDWNMPCQFGVSSNKQSLGAAQILVCY